MVQVDRAERRNQHQVPASFGAVQAHGSFAIVITTYEDRQIRSCLPLVRGLRQSGITAPIIVVINGCFGRAYNTNLRKEFCQKLLIFDDINIVALRKMVPLARAWNIGIQNANSDVCIVLNDDLAISGRGPLEDCLKLVQGAERGGLCVGNSSFSHFAVSNECLAKVGWFDERYLGVGEEDGDYAWRYEAAYGRPVGEVALRSFGNLEDPSNGGYVEGIGKYSLACRVFREMKFKPDDGGIQGMYERPQRREINEIDPYPLWRLHQEIDSILSETETVQIQSAIRRLTG
jgi:hypothetical protein